MGLLGLITFGIRWSFLSLSGNARLHPVLDSMMHYIPAAVFAALCLPALWFARAQSYELHDPARLLAGLVGAIVAWFTRSVLFTILSGMASLWILRFLLEF
jgi:branched-subunit amino acid transport protein